MRKPIGIGRVGRVKGTTLKWGSRKLGDPTVLGRQQFQGPNLLKGGRSGGARRGKTIKKDCLEGPPMSRPVKRVSIWESRGGGAEKDHR